jgi:hypothetical protein
MCCEPGVGRSGGCSTEGVPAALPDDAFTGSYPDLDPDWDFDFNDNTEMRHRLPRLATLFLSDQT